MLLTITIPAGADAGKRRVIAVDTPERIRASRLLAYTANPTLEYREQADHNGEQVGDILPALERVKRAAKPKATKEPKTWSAFFRRYPTADAWLEAHPGRVVARVLNPPERVQWFTRFASCGQELQPNYRIMWDGQWNDPIPDDVALWPNRDAAMAATLDDHKARLAEQEADAA